MSWQFTYPLAPLVTIIFLLVAGACGEGSQASLEQRALSIDRSLICPVCPGETIDQSQVELAKQMRALVREKLAEGWSREQILDFFVQRYEEKVLAAPPKEGFNLIAWVVPPAAMVTAGFILFLVVRAMRRTGPKGEEEGPLEEGDLEPYMASVDRELGLFNESSQEAKKGG